MDSLAYMEDITDAYSQYFVNDIEHTENKLCQKRKLSFEQILVSFCMVFPCSLIISKEIMPAGFPHNLLLFSSSWKAVSKYS